MALDEVLMRPDIRRLVCADTDNGTLIVLGMKHTYQCLSVFAGSAFRISTRNDDDLI